MISIIILLIIEGFAFFFINQIFDLTLVDYQVASSLLLVINTIVFVSLLGKHSRNKTEYIILIFAYFIRIILLYWDMYGSDIFSLPNSGVDSEGFHRNALNVAEGLSSGQGGNYSIFLGGIYYLFGEQRIIGQYVNVLFGMFTILLLKKIFEKIIKNNKIFLTLLLIVSFLPNFAVMNVILLRESIIIFLVTLSLYFFLKWWKKGSFIKLMIALILPIIASLFHSGSIAIVLGYIIIITFYDRRSRRFIFNYQTVISGILGIGLLFILNTLFSDLLFSKFNSIDSAADLNKTAQAYTDGGSAYLQNIESNNPIIMILLTPIRMFYFIASPLPWDWRSFSDIFAFMFSSLFYIITIFFGIRSLNIKNTDYKNLNIALLIMAVVTMIFFSWGVSNSGTALRHREKFLAIYMLLLAISYIRLKNKKTNKNLN